MSLEIITETGSFGFLLVLTYISFIFLGYKHIKMFGVFKSIMPILGVSFGIFVSISIASDLIGKTSFDVGLYFLITTLPFIAHIFITLIYIINAKGIDKLIGEEVHKREQR